MMTTASHARIAHAQKLTFVDDRENELELLRAGVATADEKLALLQLTVQQQLWNEMSAREITGGHAH